MFALVDCNNFYASCERLFRPDLQNVPIVVLSNNDGCVIARSNEAKAIGVKMGEPFFGVKALCKQYGVQIFSSNYTLYGDLSDRVMSVIEEAWDNTEIYSIDEAFLDLSALPAQEVTSFCETLQKKILKHVGIPTSIGIGPTKTLAKAANHVAKKELKIPVFNITHQMQWLLQMAAGDIWGVGRQWQKKLMNIGVYTAADLKALDHAFVKTKFNVVLQRTVLELKGRPCLQLEIEEPKQSIMSSRSFGTMQTELSALEQSISYHIATAWTKMRAQGLTTQHLSVFIRSNPHRNDLKQYSNSIGFRLVNPTDDICYLTKAAKFCLKKIYRPGIQYKKCGVLLADLRDKSHQQIDLFHQPTDESLAKNEKLMSVMDAINKKYDRNTIRLASEGFKKSWSMKRELKTPNYTTQWSELPVAHAR